MSTARIDRERGWVTKKDNSAILYRDYQFLKFLANVKQHMSLYDVYEDQIKLDLPRSFPASKWLKNPRSEELVKRQLKIWCIYSHIGYFQGMLFLLVPLCKRYEGLDHISFFAFATLIKRLYFVNNDVISFNKQRRQKPEVLHVLRVLGNVCPEVRDFDQDQLQRLSLKIEFSIMFTLFLNRVGTDLCNTDIILDYFLVVMHEKKKFVHRLKCFSFAVILCLLKGNICLEELAQIELTREALQGIIHCALSSGTLFKAFA